MSKKQNTTKKVNNSTKPVKAKAVSKKADTAKSVKKTVNKSGAKKASKPVKISSQSVKKAGAKKVAPKKVVKPAKKVVVKKTAPKKAVKSSKESIKKPIKKEIIKKTAKKVIKPVLPVKSISKIEVIVVKGAKKTAAKPSKPVKEEKKATGKPDKKKEEKEIIKPVKTKPARGKGGRKPKQKNDDDEPEIVHDELIEQLILSTKKKRQGPKVPKILKTFVNPMTSLTVAPSENSGKKGNAVPKKEPKGKFELEYVIRTSAGILYEFITSPSGLSEWFADDVNIRDGVFTFFWDGSEQKATLLGFKEEKFIRLRWNDKPEGSYFEFRIERDELTGDISLIIIDFADEASDMQTSKLLWDSQVNKLLGVLGSN